MGLVVAMQRNDTLALLGCMIMQSTIWPWLNEVNCGLHQRPFYKNEPGELGKMFVTHRFGQRMNATKAISTGSNLVFDFGDPRLNA